MYKRYEKYKDSGVEWIGEIPEGWDLKRIDWITRYNKSSVDLKYLKGKQFFYYSIPVLEESGDGKYEEGDNIDSNKIKLIGNEVIISKLNPRKSRVLIVGKKEVQIICSTEFVPLIPVNCNQEFLYYFYMSDNTKQIISSFVQSATKSHQRARPSNITKLWSYIPPLNEQKAIATFLNYKTSEIDSLIADKEKLIEKLEEYKQSIITEAVTKGLNPDVKMKDSGVEWIGEIPEHWDLKKVKHLSSYIGSGKTPRGGSEIYKDSGILFLRSQNIYSYGLKLTDKVYISEEIDSDMRNTRVRNLDVLLNITGASIGRSSIVPEGFTRSNVNQHVCIIRPLLNKVIPSLLHKNLISKSVQDQIFMHQTGSSREGLNFVQVANLMLVMPPTISEQEELSNYLGERIASLETLIAEILDSIKMLISFRHALIYEAVTGKIDVRDYEPERSEQLA